MKRSMWSARGGTRTRTLLCALVALVGVAAGLALGQWWPVLAGQAEPEGGPTTGPAPMIVPVPASMTAPRGERFTLGRGTRIVVPGNGTRAGAVETAHQLARMLRPATGYPLPVVTGQREDGRDSVARAGAGHGNILVSLAPDRDLGAEGYRLDVRSGGVELTAATSAGLFHGVQTIRQLLPPWVESATVRPGPWTMPGVRVVDRPRYAYRGVMLDIARHFQPPAAVKRLIDDAAAYKLNVLHLHLSDDQGFRIAIEGRPELTEIGGQFSVDNDPGGSWTQREYVDVVKYAAKRHMTVVPEVDSPGHTNAIAMAYNAGPTPTNPVYPDLNCGAHHPPEWNLGFSVGYSALCPESEHTWAVMSDIIEQLSAMSPGPYYHLGGDEVPRSVLSRERYAAFVDRESRIVADRGKTVMGWAEISAAGFDRPGAPAGVAQFWNKGDPTGPDGDTARVAVQKGMKVVLSPASHTYLDMKQVADSPLGLSWAGVLDVSHFYHWSGSTSDPGTYIPGRTAAGVRLPAVTDADILGVEAPIWSETLKTLADVEFQAFPRLPATAELGWSPAYDPVDAPQRTLASFVERVAARGTGWQLRHQNFHASPQVPWRIEVAADDRTSRTRTFDGDLATVAAPGVPLDDLTATVDWGDGRTSAATLTGSEPTSSTVNSLYAAGGRHTYERPGRYVASITVARNGTTTTDRFTVVVGGRSSR